MTEGISPIVIRSTISYGSRMRPNWIDLSRFPGSSEAAQESGDSAVGQPNATDGERAGDDILLIEDDTAIAEMYEFGLHLSGYPVHLARSGEAALEEIATETRFGVIILDLQLPHMSGIQTLDELRHRPSTANVPVIVLSNEDTLFLEAYQHGATECHPKFRTTPKELSRYVEGAIRGAA